MSERKKIVLVEDDPAINEATVMLLEISGFDAVGYLGVEELHSASLDDTSLFLVDRQLGDGDGLDLCSKIKTDPALAHVPVIIMSASPDARQLAVKAGADSFLEKPFSRSQLKRVIDELITG